MTNVPLFCTLTPTTLKSRREGLLNELQRRAVTHHETDTGHVFEFSASGDTLALVARAVDAERQCCRFLRFHITVEPDEGAIRLELTGPAGSREFLSAVLEP
jgi:hypothetical protein